MSTALFTDLYELTKAKIFPEHHKTGYAVFGTMAHSYMMAKRQSPHRCIRRGDLFY